MNREVAVDQIGDAGRVRPGLPAPAGGQSAQTRASHQHRHGVVADGDAPTDPQLGVDTRRPVGAPRGRMDLADQIGQPGVADRPCRGRSARSGVVAGARHLEDTAGELDRQALLGDHRDRLKAPFGGTASRRSSAARRATASSASSWTIRRRAAISSAWSLLLTPGRTPLSICSWRRQL